MDAPEENWSLSLSQVTSCLSHICHLYILNRTKQSEMSLKKYIYI